MMIMTMKKRIKTNKHTYKQKFQNTFEHQTPRYDQKC